jgi:hypothetical protein
MLKFRKPLLPSWHYWPALPFALLILACMAGASLPPIPPQHSTEQSSTGPRFKQKINSTVLIKTADDRIADYTWWLTFFTAVLGGASIFQAYFLIRADATAKIAADAARKSADTAADTAKKELRAYVNVATARVHNLEKTSGRHIIVETRNFGKTPAHDERFLCGEHVREWPLQTILPPPPENLRTSVDALPPGRKSIMKIPVSDLSEWEECELRDGRAGVYFWGTITYTDVFGDPHFTNIRLVCEGEGLASGHMHATEDGNDAN